MIHDLYIYKDFLYSLVRMTPLHYRIINHINCVIDTISEFVWQDSVELLNQYGGVEK